MTKDKSDEHSTGAIFLKKTFNKKYIFLLFILEGILIYLIGLLLFSFLGEKNFFMGNEWIIIIIMGISLIGLAHVWLLNEIRDLTGYFKILQHSINFDNIDQRGQGKLNMVLDKLSKSDRARYLWILFGIITLDGYIILTWLKILPISELIYENIYERLPAVSFFLTISSIGGFSFGYVLWLLIKYINDVLELTKKYGSLGYVTPPASMKNKHFWEYLKRFQEDTEILGRISRIALYFTIIGFGFVTLSTFTLLTMLPAIDFYTVAFLFFCTVGLISFYGITEYRVHSIIMLSKKKFWDNIKVSEEEGDIYHDLIMMSMFIKNIEEWTVDISVIFEIVVAALMPIFGAYLALMFR